jgi:uncharacterized protein YwlG (UPF0340 family)
MKGITYQGQAYIKVEDAEKLTNEWYEKGYRQGVRVCLQTCEMIGCAEAAEAILETDHEINMVKVKPTSTENKA